MKRVAIFPNRYRSNSSVLGIVTILLGMVYLLIFSFYPGKRILSNEVSGETFIRSAIDPGYDVDSLRISGKDTLASPWGYIGRW